MKPALWSPLLLWTAWAHTIVHQLCHIGLGDPEAMDHGGHGQSAYLPEFGTVISPSKFYVCVNFFVICIDCINISLELAVHTFGHCLVYKLRLAFYGSVNFISNIFFTTILVDKVHFWSSRFADAQT